MLSVLEALAAFARFFTGLLAFLTERRQIQVGEDRAVAQSLKEQLARVQKARAARRAAAARGLQDDDPDLRD